MTLLHINISGYLVLHIIFLRQNFLCVGGTTQYSWQSFSCIGRNTTRLYLSPSASLFFRTSSVKNDRRFVKRCSKSSFIRFCQSWHYLQTTSDLLSLYRAFRELSTLIILPGHITITDDKRCSFKLWHPCLPGLLLSITFPACMISAPNLVSGPSSMCDGLTIGQNFIVSRF